MDFRALSLLTLLLSGCVLAQAELEETSNRHTPLKPIADLLDNNWEITGFATLGYTQSDKYDDRVLRRNVSQDGNKLHDNGFLVDSRVGVQLKGDISDHWELVFQGVLKHQFATNFDDYIDVAFARYRASNDWQFTLGRQPFDLFILSDHINVGYSYDFVRPPTEFYGFLPYDSFDGVKVSRNWGDFDNDWNWTFSVGFIEEQFDSDSFNVVEEGEDDDTDITKARPIYNTAINWRSDHWFVRANFAWLKFEQELSDSQFLTEFENAFAPIWTDIPRIRNDFTVNNILRYASVGAAWENGDWKIQSEISKIDADFVHYNGERAYIHASKRIGDWMPYVTLGYAHDDSERNYQRVDEIGLPADFPYLPLFQEIEGIVDEQIALAKQNQRSLGVGVRWDFDHQKALKFQCDRNWFKAGSGSIHGRRDNIYNRDETRTWCSLNLDWVF